MDRRIGYSLRASVAAVGVSAGFMVLATTAQTPDGFVHASLGGPLELFGTVSPDVLAIGDGSNDASELAALLKAPAKEISGSPDSPYRVAFEAGSTPDTLALNVFPADEPAGALTTKQSLDQISKPIVDSEGRVDCSGSVSCNFDPATKVTTVTYPDGVVALVQKVNDMTVVAYKTVAETLRNQLQALVPAAPAPVPSPMAAAAAPTQTPAPVLPPPAAEAAVPPVNPGPAAPDPVTEPSTKRQGPRVSVTRPPMDFTPGRDGSILPNGGNGSAANLDRVKDALDSFADAVGDAVDKVGKAIGAGAADKPAS